MKSDEREVWDAARALLTQYSEEVALDVERLGQALRRRLDEAGHFRRLRNEAASYGPGYEAFYEHVLTKIATDRGTHELGTEAGRRVLLRKKP